MRQRPLPSNGGLYRRRSGRLATIALVLPFSVAMLFSEVSCARMMEGFGLKSDITATLRERLARAQGLVDRALHNTSPRPGTRTAGPIAVPRSQLLQLRSELTAAQTVAASDLDTEVKIQTLRARINRTERVAATLVAPLQPSRAARTPVARASGTSTVSASAANSTPELITIDRATLQQLKTQLDLAGRLAPSS
jgi:hypothetical protein